MEPKSIHTYLDSQISDVYAYEVDVCITHFPQLIERSWLYYFSLQVNFTDHDEWSHGGFQWSNTPEFRDNGNKGVNWGGGSDWAGYGGIGVNNIPFRWECGRWYRYRVCRVDDDLDGNHRWQFTVLDYVTREVHQFGTVRTKSYCIAKAVVFTETGYGVRCDSPTARVEWRNPYLYTPLEKAKPQKIVANYNGTCSNPTNTNQGLLSSYPIVWFHQTNTQRIIEPNTCIWPT